jgi:YD repeat-containing protein
MQGLRRVGKVALTGGLTVVFLVSSLLPKQSLRPAYAVEPVPIPLPAVEDPLGQQPEQSTPEISVNVDVRDGHLTVRVVDLWGPGRVPLVYRSYTNGTLDPDYQPSTNPAPYRWQFNHPLDVIGTDVLEPGGVRSVYRWSSDRWNPSHTELWQVYVTDTGSSTNAVGLPAVSGLFRTMEMHYTCDTGGGGNKAAPAPAAPAKPVPGAQGQVAAAPPGCIWDNTHVVYLPKGVVRRYLNRKIVEERDANGNATTFSYTTFGDGYGTYLSTVTDPVGRQLSYAWEHDFQKCVQMSGGDCVQWKWVYRVQRVTDGTSGRSASYAYNANGLMTSALNGAGRTTSYTYEPVGFDSLGRLAQRDERPGADDEPDVGEHAVPGDAGDGPGRGAHLLHAYDQRGPDHADGGAGRAEPLHDLRYLPR